MKKYSKEIIILLIQLLMFYIYPLLVGMENPFGMVLMIVLITFILSTIIGRIIKGKIKYLYPILISVLFIPSVFIYYNESALVHSLWYLVVSYIGIGLGTLIYKLKNNRNIPNKKNCKKYNVY